DTAIARGELGTGRGAARVAPAAKMHGARGRDRDFWRDPVRHHRFEKLEVVDEDAARRPAQFAGDYGTRRLDLSLALGRREPHFDFSRHHLNIDELGKEIRVPHFAPEFAVGGDAKTNVLLHLHDIADGLVLVSL